MALHLNIVNVTGAIEQWTIENSEKKNKMNYEKLSIAKSASALWRGS